MECIGNLLHSTSNVREAVESFRLGKKWQEVIEQVNQVKDIFGWKVDVQANHVSGTLCFTASDQHVFSD